ncbi:MAG: hypothetical protein ACRDPS_22295 [Nocardioides sp.]|uniref:hypothetical protein n=1 Tax=Nocardioides sp. TaxID=35761 RepID=UPI003D6AB6B3
MDTEATRDHQVAPSGATAGPAEEFGGQVNDDAVEHGPHGSLGHHAKSSDATAEVTQLAEQFAGILYFATRGAGAQGERRPTRHRTARGVSGAESVRSARGRQAPVRPWRVPGHHPES